MLTACLMAVTTALGEVNWEKSFAAAAKKAAAAKRPIFVDFYADWCGPCKQLETSFKDPSVDALLRNAICLHIDVDRNPADAERFRVSSIPRLLLIAPDGKKVLWDAVGYRDAAMLRDELREAMNVKASVMAPPPKAAIQPPALTRVQKALTDGTFGQLKAADPVLARKGLNLLVLKLGAFKESDFKPVAALLKKAGRDALPALVDGMGHRTLAVRVGASKVAQATLTKDEVKSLPFDPWAPTPARTLQLVAWRRFAKVH
ncbi:MAG: thioredoxin family protein [Fimbriimonas sp.]